MFDIGFLELLICGVIALLVLGPERLPSAARAAGRWIGSARRMMTQFTSELDRELYQIDQQVAQDQQDEQAHGARLQRDGAADQVGRLEIRYDGFSEEFTSILQRHARRSRPALTRSLVGRDRRARRRRNR